MKHHEIEGGTPSVLRVCDVFCLTICGLYDLLARKAVSQKPSKATQLAPVCGLAN